MADTNGFMSRVLELAAKLDVECGLGEGGIPYLAEANIPIKTFRVFAYYHGEHREVAMGREPLFPIARLFLSSLVERGTPSIEITHELVMKVADFFGIYWINGLSGEHMFLFGIHVGSQIELEWE